MDSCVVCGSYIAEGSQVCKYCITSLKAKKIKNKLKEVEEII